MILQTKKQNPRYGYPFLKWLFALAFLFVPFTAFSEYFLKSGTIIERIENIDGHSFKGINKLLQDKSGFLWLASDKGLLRFDGFSIITFTHDKNNANSLPHNKVLNLLEDDQGYLWLITQGGGLSRFDPKHFTFTNFAHDVQDLTSLDSNKLLSLSLAKDNKLWIGSEQGINLFDRETLQNQRMTATLIPNSDGNNQGVVAILEDKQQRLWFSVRNKHLFMHDPQLQKTTRFKHHANNKHSLSANDVNQIITTRDGVIWIGTTAGLNKFDDKNQHFKRFYLPGIKHDRGVSLPINRLYEDRQNRLWLSYLNRGVYVFEPGSQSVIEFTQSNLGNKEWLPLIVRDIYQDRSGALWFADAQTGLNKMPTDHKMFERWQDKTLADYSILLSDFRLFNEPIGLATKTVESPLTQSLNHTDKITLSYKNFWFSLAFASSNFNDAQSIRYAYKLEGFADQWITTDNKSRVATFTSLPADDYTLKIKTSNPDGSWSEQHRSLQITVTPPWWFTWKAYTLYVLLVLAEFYAFFHYRTKSLHKKANELEKGVKQRTATINQLMAQKERMFTNISHEFKTPLTLILNPLTAILQDPDAKKYDRKLSMMKRNGQRLLRMVDQLLEISKLDSTTSQQQFQCRLGKTLNMLLASFQPLLDSKKLSLTVETYDDVVLLIKADSLEMILTNLLSNAIKYTPDAGKIRVEVTRIHEQVSIAVIDSGIGIDAKNQQIVFNRFTRGNDCHDENIPGAGIGLALVKELAEANNGSVSLTSQRQQGSTFTVVLPISNLEEAVVESANELSHSSQIEIDSLVKPEPLLLPKTDSQGVDDTKPTLLLIDDNPDMLELLVQTLDSHYSCNTASNGESGLELAQQQMPDLVVSDLMMPGISGFEVVKRLKQNELTNHIPVILLTAKGDSQSRVEGWAQKADEYIEKPFNALELHSRIDNLLEIRALLRRRYQREFSTTKMLGTAQNKQQTAELAGAHQLFITRVNEVLENNYERDDFDVTFMAEQLFMSTRQLGRKMKSLLDLSPIESIRTYRLKKAAEQLADGIPVSVVAFAVGFTSHSYFSRCFKAQYDCMPSNYGPT
jgi:signal transduction histidine kinase/DNA-binding response OmpR family regulator/streptogramin lyase